MACKDLNLIHEEALRDLPPSIDKRGAKSQDNSAHPALRHGHKTKPLWMDAKSNPPRVRGSDGRRSLLTEFQRERNSVLDLIRSCGKLKDLSKAGKVHEDILSQQLFHKDFYVGKALITMYAKCGALSKAQEVFDGLPERDVVSWTALIGGYAQHGFGHEALDRFRQMRNEGFYPNDVTFICALKACTAAASLEMGEAIHAEVKKLGILPKNIVLATALVGMYAKCGVLEKAQDVFDQLPARDVISWNALISGYVQHGFGNEALRCFGQMHDEGSTPNTITFLSALKACSIMGSGDKGKEIHAEAKKRGLLEKDIMLGTAVVDMYAKCGMLQKAREAFNELPSKDSISWNALISGYSHHGLGNEALACFRKMRDEGFSPSAVTYICVLNACGSIKCLEMGEAIHAEVSKQRLLEKEIVLGTALVDMYARCGELRKAQKVFDDLPVRNVVSWNALICGYAQQGWGDESVNCYWKMQGEGISPNAVTFICILKICSALSYLELGETIHCEVRKQGLLNKDIVIGTALVDMYSKCGALGKAQEVFNELLIRDVVVWNALISGCVQHGFCEEALDCFKQMRDEGLCPDTVTYSCILNVCGSLEHLELGEEIHAEICKEKLLSKDIVLGTALVDMYAKCNALEKAQQVFDEIPKSDVISWNAIISGYTEHGRAEDALKCYRQMQDAKMSPNITTFISILKACGITRQVELGETIHSEINNQGLLKKDVILGTGLVDMYAKCGLLEKAQEVFDKIPIRDVVCWNALMSGYAQYELGDEVLNCFAQMRDKGLSPNSVTFSCVLKACGSIGYLEMGKEIHFEIKRQGLLGKDIVLTTALLDMYAKCGMVAKAKEILAELSLEDVVSWNTLMAGYGQLGHAKGVLNLFSEMMKLGVVPNLITFLVLLTSCSHAGLVEEGQKVFDIMNMVYCLTPTLEHYACMVDLFTRVGHLDKAVSLIEKVPASDRFQLWLAFLGACQKWKNVELGIWAFEQAVELDAKHASAYVCMGNIYAAAGMQEEAEKMIFLSRERK